MEGEEQTVRKLRVPLQVHQFGNRRAEDVSVQQTNRLRLMEIKTVRVMACIHERLFLLKCESVLTGSLATNPRAKFTANKETENTVRIAHIDSMDCVIRL